MPIPGEEKLKAFSFQFALANFLHFSLYNDKKINGPSNSRLQRVPTHASTSFHSLTHVILKLRKITIFLYLM